MLAHLSAELLNLFLQLRMFLLQAYDMRGIGPRLLHGSVMCSLQAAL